MLCVWLPLNGDLHNQGLSNFNIVTNNVTFVNTGKIGQCASFNGSNSYIYINNINLGNNWSYGCWINTPVSDSRGWEIVIILNNTGSDADSQLAFWVHQKENRFETLANTQYNSTISYAAYYGTWHHFFATFNGNVLTTYIDGIIVNTKTITAAQYTGTNLTIGARCTGANGSSFGNYFQGQLNDVRLYDHCLSDKEVEEIAKGLVLHYKLDNNGLGGNNLALHTYDLSVGSSKNNLNMYIRGASTRQLRSDGFYESKTTANWQGLSFWANQLNLSVGTKITYSFYIYGNGSSRAFSFYPMMYNSAGIRDTSTGMPISIDGGAYTTVNAKAFNATTATTPEYHYVTFEWNQAVANIISNGGSIELSIQVHGTWNNGDWACLFAPKVEIGNTPTLWSPNPADLGINSSIVYDSSGYGNNGVITGNVQTDSNTIQYSCSMKQENGQYIRVEKRPVECMPKDAITVNLWQYATSWYNPISCTEGGGWNFENSNGIRFPVYISGVGYKVAQSSITTASTLNSWHMLTGTMDKDNIKIYYDGQEVGTVANGSTNGIGYANNYIFIGGEAQGNSTSPASSAYVGNLSDVRIYATALTAEQIKELYNTSATIDNKGNIYARELVEI